MRLFTAKKLSVLLLTLLSVSLPAFAEEIEFPEEELARESTLPIFDKQRAVLNRRVVTDGKVEIGVGGGLEMNEPYYSDYMFNLQGTYNLNETSAINISGLMWMDGLSDYGTQLKQGSTGTNPFPSFDASKAPHPKWGLFANYEFIAYYGKISLSKQTVMNLNLFAIAGVGYINMDTTSTVGLNLGLGQNFFITKNVGIRADLRWVIFQGPNPPTSRLGPSDSPKADDFDKRIFYNAQLGLGLVFIL